MVAVEQISLVKYSACSSFNIFLFLNDDVCVDAGDADRWH
jgi:hypothetical protein